MPRPPATDNSAAADAGNAQRTPTHAHLPPGADAPCAETPRTDAAPPYATHPNATPTDALHDNPTPSDEALMLALSNGEDAALAMLMSRWETGVKGFLLRLGIAHADVDDIAQETFVRVYRKKHTFRSGARFKPWLLTIAGNLGRNRLRWRLRRREHSIDATGGNADSGSATSTNTAQQLAPLADESALPANQLAERNCMLAAVREAVDALPDKLRRVIVCVDLEYLSYAETAQVAGCSIKAVESRLLRARCLLRERCARFLTNR